MINEQQKRIMSGCVEVMWECYQRIARTPEDDEQTKRFIRARDIHQILAQPETEDINL